MKNLLQFLIKYAFILFVHFLPFVINAQGTNNRLKSIYQTVYHNEQGTQNDGVAIYEYSLPDNSFIIRHVIKFSSTNPGWNDLDEFSSACSTFIYDEINNKSLLYIKGKRINGDNYRLLVFELNLDAVNDANKSMYVGKIVLTGMSNVNSPSTNTNVDYQFSDNLSTNGENIFFRRSSTPADLVRLRVDHLVFDSSNNFTQTISPSTIVNGNPVISIFQVFINFPPDNSADHNTNDYAFYNGNFYGISDRALTATYCRLSIIDNSTKILTVKELMLGNQIAGGTNNFGLNGNFSNFGACWVDTKGHFLAFNNLSGNVYIHQNVESNTINGQPNNKIFKVLNSLPSTSNDGFSDQVDLFTPLIDVRAATCFLPGRATISNYISPSDAPHISYVIERVDNGSVVNGITINNNGVISGLNFGVLYRVVLRIIINSNGNNLDLSYESPEFMISNTLPAVNASVIPVNATTNCAAPSVQLTASGGETYSWTPTTGLSNPNIANPIATPSTTTTYTVTVTNASGCIATANTTINVDNTPVAPIIISISPTCLAEGISTISNYNAANTYTFTPSGPIIGVNGVISGMNIGTNYTVTASNIICGSITSSQFSNGSIKLPPTIPLATATQPTCGVPTGTIVFTSQVGVEYSINDGVSYQSGVTFSGLTPGSYILRVRSLSDVTCTTQGATIIINAVPTAPTIPLATATQPTCGVPTGTIVFTSQVGVEYSINDGVSYQSGVTFSGLTPGSYILRVRSLSDVTCTTQGATIIINAVPTVPTIPLATATQPTCGVPTGTIVFTSQVGVEYSINDGVSYQSGVTFSGLTPGSYILRVRSLSDVTCTTQGATIIINAVPTAPTIPLATATQPTCGVPTGTIVFTSQVGVEYSINDGVSYQSGVTFSGLTPGSYILRVRSLSDVTCTTQGATIIINAVPTAPTIPLATATQPTCGVPTGTIVFTSQVGVEYSINDGVSYQSGVTFSGLTPGSYILRVRSLSDVTCTTQGATIIINAVPTAPTIPLATATQPTCGVPTGTIVFTSQVGVEYSINDGVSYQSGVTFSGLTPGSYILRVRSLSDVTCTTQGATIIINAVPTAPTIPLATATQPTCGVPTGTIVFTSQVGVEYSINDGVSYQSGVTFSGLTPGSYILRVRSLSDVTCTTQGATIIINAVPTAPTIPLATATQPTCGVPTGTIVFTSQVGVEYSINDGVSYQSGVTFSGLTPGSYILRVRSLSDVTCTTQGATIIINAVPTAPTIPLATATQPTCGVPTGTIVFTSQVGVEYSINDGVSYQSGVTFSGLTPGSYILRVRSLSDVTCTTQGATIIINAVPTAPTIPLATATQPTCGVPTGTIVFTSQVGVEYSINDGVSYQSGVTFSGLTPGSYILRVRSLSDVTCTTQGATIIINAVPTVPNIPIVGIPTQPECPSATGSVLLSGLPVGNWIINPGGITGNTPTVGVTNLNPGTYNFTVTNELGCTSLASANVIINDIVCPECYEINPIKVFNAVSPGVVDGINDFFFIQALDDLDCYPTNSVQIYNRWGVLVFERNQYTNDVNSGFVGISEGRVTVNKSERLPEGTYFYIINYTNKNADAFNLTGYLYLKWN